MLPLALLLLVFLTYPLGLGVWLGLTNQTIGRAGRFIGTLNYELLADDSVFWLSVFNTVLYTTVASVFKFGLGVAGPHLNKRVPFQAIVRAIVLLPWIIPTCFRHRLLVDLRLAIFDRQLELGEARPDRHLHRLPGQPNWAGLP